MRLDPIDPALAARIVARDERAGDDWHAEYPFEDERDPLRALAARESADPVFTMYVIRDDEGVAVGGFGFFGPPDQSGTVEFGYGLVPSARGRGLATAAVAEGLRIAAAHGAVRAIADTEETNSASLAVLARSGMTETRRENGFVHVAREL
ncbi:GNAT family N-acetyltransferase [Microbacterium azadirachtae]|uniref:GNAT family N-acetyltransferase n=1 Tax=Microbacterium azadirachtae TaxID=582680 RepID=UPI00088644C8|nr:GNAT family N-acetyltransferase [Microbacterium azadirachtae]UXW85962.1 GNAT family N-acetyltransferase [Microbacterium azadirachtae]SDL67528.1 Protein N-acetyltransferase, RimJ/RimL family [Microbacterium azadirachtae]SEF97031.1 Protein N-acetyltransferase, RimJ/RimL family [Microbacterium azadirachtae]SEF99309.1 Protein N-acetyltransferase, RimJ/RimL family [Microbacterium azadirachtae]